MTSKRVMFSFPKGKSEKPIVWYLIKEYDLIINIFRAKVTPDEHGYMVVDVSGSEENMKRGMDYARAQDIEVNEADVGVTWDRNKCTHCGNCLPHCPTHALRIGDNSSRAVEFFPGDCVECLACLQNCPFGACASLF